MEHEHDSAGDIMARLRVLTEDFTPPTDACNTHRATYAKLEEFESDLHRHIHLENNLLFPMAIRLEESLVAAQ
jgi:regulator of cell morphogenesis and NO signaling